MQTPNRTLIKVLIYASLIGSGFVAGQQFERFIYTDICLDMGGGRNPTGYPICVLER